MKERIRIKLEASCLRRQEYGREAWSKMGAGISYTSEHMSREANRFANFILRRCHSHYNASNFSTV